MKKAAIFTWCYRARTNYGQILQCYAMQKLCKKHDLSPVVIRYRRMNDEEPTPKPFHSSARADYEREYRIQSVEGLDFADERIEHFFSFIDENIHGSDYCYTVDEIKNEISDSEVLLCGSDMIWNPPWFDPVMTLFFANENQKRISYAASGVHYDDAKSAEVYRELGTALENFDAISVREPISIEILKKYTTKPVTDVLDPTLMLSAAEWNQVCANRLIKDDYIFCYFMEHFQPHKLVLRKIAEKYHVSKVIYIKSNYAIEKINEEDIYEEYDSAGPAEFLSLIRYAKAICTDSFHGVAISLIYEKQFYCVKRAYVKDSVISNARTENIMNKFQIQNRQADSIKFLREMREIDYVKVHKRMNEWIARSNEFLQRALET